MLPGWTGEKVKLRFRWKRSAIWKMPCAGSTTPK